MLFKIFIYFCICYKANLKCCKLKFYKNKAICLIFLILLDIETFS